VLNRDDCGTALALTGLKRYRIAFGPYPQSISDIWIEEFSGRQRTDRQPRPFFWGFHTSALIPLSPEHDKMSQKT
jgi:hypothetical protein